MHFSDAIDGGAGTRPGVTIDVGGQALTPAGPSKAAQANAMGPGGGPSAVVTHNDEGTTIPPKPVSPLLLGAAGLGLLFFLKR